MKLTFFEVFGDPAQDGECTVLRMGEADIVIGQEMLPAMIARDMPLTIKDQEYRLKPAPHGGVWSGWVNLNTRRQRPVRFAEITRTEGKNQGRRIVLLQGTLVRGEAIEDVRPTGALDALAHDGLVCFARGTRILTAFGDLPVEHLRVGDLVHTVDNGLQPIRWIGAREIGPARLFSSPQLAPVRIQRDAFGPGLPTSDLLVSPRHRILTDTTQTPEGYLNPAAALCDASGISPEPSSDGVSYHHLMFDQHELVYAENLPSESFFPNPAAIAALDEPSRAALLEAAPNLKTHPLGYGPTIRPVAPTVTTAMHVA